MNKNEMKKIEKMMNEMMIEIDFNEENQKYQLSKKNYQEISEFLNDNLDENISIENFEIKSQIHIKRDRDIKIDMRKINNYNLKLIYHRKKDNEKEYRLFISYKDEEKNLKRIRMIDDKIKSIHSDEKKMIDFFNKISEKNISEYLKRKIS